MIFQTQIQAMMCDPLHTDTQTQSKEALLCTKPPPHRGFSRNLWQKHAGTWGRAAAALSLLRCMLPSLPAPGRASQCPLPGSAHHGGGSESPGRALPSCRSVSRHSTPTTRTFHSLWRWHRIWRSKGRHLARTGCDKNKVKTAEILLFFFCFSCTKPRYFTLTQTRRNPWPFGVTCIRRLASTPMQWG